MEPILEFEIEEKRDGHEERTQRILLEIATDARKLKARYLSETVVPEGGE